MANATPTLLLFESTSDESRGRTTVGCHRRWQRQLLYLLTNS